MLEHLRLAVETIGLLVIEAVGSLTGFNVLTALGITGGTLAATAVASAVGSVILIGGAVGLQMLLARRPGSSAFDGAPALPSPDAGHQPLRQPIPPRIAAYGRVRLGGSYVFFEATSGISVDIVALHHGKVTNFVAFYLHDDPVVLSGGVVQAMGDGRYGSSKISIDTRTGNVPETAYSFVVSTFPTVWTNSHRGDGIATLQLTCNPVTPIDNFPTIYPRGLPLPSAVCDCTPIFDPRDGTQSIGNTATWKVSSNGVVQLMDVLTSSDRGMGFDWDEVIAPRLAEWKAEASLCDDVVLKISGSEPRYASNGSFALDSDPADVIASILDTCDGWISEDGNGAIIPKVGVYRAPELVIKSKHIKGVTLQLDLAEEEAINELTIDYTEPLLDYKTAPGDPWRNEADITERGRVLSQRFALPWVYSHSQARRLAKRRDAQNNAQLRGTIRTTLYGLQAIGERWIKIEAPDIPRLENVVVENRGMTFDLLNAQCIIKIILVNPNAIDAWNPATEEGSPPEIPAKLVIPPPPVPTNPVGIQFISGPWQLFRITFDDTGRSDLKFQWQARLNGTADPFVEGPALSASFGGAGKQKIEDRAPLAGPNAWDVQIRSIGPSGSVFSAWTSTFVIPSI